MSGEPCVWLEPADYEVRGGNVHIHSVSGGKEVFFCMSRADLRTSAENALRVLDRQDARERLTLWKSDFAEHQAAS
jgi:hypothetical protein